MYKILPLLFFWIFIPHFLKSQSYHIGFKSGYAFPILKQKLGTNDTNNSFIYISFGKGITNELSFEYTLKPEIALQANISYLLGDKQITDKYAGITEYSSEQIRSNFSFKIYKSISKINFYNQIGFSIPLQTSFYRTITRDEKKYYTQIKGYNIPAFAALLGLNKKISPKLTLAIEFQAIAQRIRVKQLSVDGKLINYPFNQTYELPFSSLSTQINVNYNF